MAAESRAWVLGTKAELQAMIAAVLPIVDCPEDYSVTYTDEKGGYVLTFHIGSRESDEAIGVLNISVRGSGDLRPALSPLAKAYGWSLYDGSTGRLLDLAKPWPSG